MRTHVWEESTLTLASESGTNLTQTRIFMVHVLSTWGILGHRMKRFFSERLRQCKEAPPGFQEKNSERSLVFC
jgi:hypothetical protein